MVKGVFYIGSDLDFKAFWKIPAFAGITEVETVRGNHEQEIPAFAGVLSSRGRRNKSC